MVTSSFITGLLKDKLLSSNGLKKMGDERYEMRLIESEGQGHAWVINELCVNRKEL